MAMSKFPNNSIGAGTPPISKTHLFRNRLYYFLKPLIPSSFRMSVRRHFAVSRRREAAGVWPIAPGSEREPDGWSGWPGGKKFSLVLTHDVEGKAGLDKCQKLMQLEIELGFRSSFNFIPEGSYATPSELRQELAQNGFEVGVHDLKHNGRLFDSRAGFRRRSAQINRYLADWGAVGFRSGFMLHELDWLHDLDIQYDLSTFDTDPFEPQPEGRNTIFPFWVPRRGTLNSQLLTLSQGYAELPYTLPQDSTLFLVLREPNPQIWLSKLDWIAEHGGMALLNVHPDYIRFEGEPESDQTYPVAHYRRFLEYVGQRYQSRFWQALPKEVADFVTRHDRRPVGRRPLRVGMVTHSYYESDNRVTRYAEALAARGDQVDVFSLRRTPELPVQETIRGVNVLRIQDRFGKNERSKLGYLWPLLRFLKTSAARLKQSHSDEPYDIFHIHNVPDFMIFAAWRSKKQTGTPILLDIHDIVPEFFASKFRLPEKGLLYSLLRWMERTSAVMANHVIIANHLWLDKYAVRTGTADRCSVFINNVDTTIFTPRPRQRLDDKLIIIFPGGLQWHQGVDIAIRAFQRVKTELPNAEFHIYGDGNARDSLVSLSAELGLQESVKFFRPLSVREIANVMADADLGVVPKRADSFGNEAYSTKIMEFMAVGVPVVISATKVDRFYFDDSVARFFESGNAEALAHEMLDLLRNPGQRSEIAARAAEYVAENCWERRKADYLSLVDSFCRKPTAAAKAASMSKSVIAA